MLDFMKITADALDILNYDGAVQDTLEELRRKWGAQVPALLDERFDAVGVQYMRLPHEKGRRRWDRNCPPSAGPCITWTMRTSICLP